MKKAVCFAVLFVTLLSFTSCSGNTKSREIKNRVIIQGIGFDTAENGKLLISFQTLNTDVSTNSSSDSSPDSLVKCYKTEALSLSEALKNLASATGKTPLVSQNRIVIFGSNFARVGITYCLDEFIRDAENRFTVISAVAESRAEDIVFAALGENVIPARICEKVLKQSASKPENCATELYEVINSVLTDRAFVLPVIAVNDREETEFLTVTGAGLFKDGKLVNILNPDIFKGIGFLKNRVRDGSLGIMSDGGVLSVNIIKSKTEINFENTDKIRAHVRIRTTCSLAENNRDFLKPADTEFIKKTEELTSAETTKLVETSLRECIINNSADVFGITERIKRKYPSAFKYGDIDIKDIEFSVYTESKIEKTGDFAVRVSGREK